MNNRPDFLIAGPPKCASTSLHYFLGQHPQIFVSKVKEINFFTDDYGKGIDYYENNFKNTENYVARGEATPNYSLLPFVADRIKKHYPEMKIIFSFRNPMERAFSNWLMLWDAGVEKYSFADAININLKQLNIQNWEGEQAAQVWMDRRKNAGGGDAWFRTYLEGGMYAKMLNYYTRLFGEKQVKYIFSEDLKQNLDDTLKKIFTFLGADENFLTPKKEDQNYFYNRTFFRGLVKTIGVGNSRFIARHVPKNLKNIFKAKQAGVKNKMLLNVDDRMKLWEFYKQDISELEKITKKNLQHWKPDVN